MKLNPNEIVLLDNAAVSAMLAFIIRCEPYSTTTEVAIASWSYQYAVALLRERQNILQE